jgi:lipoprotein-releasing system permease protein
LNVAFFIARKVGITSKKSFSNIIMRIAIVAIALSIMVMILATSIVRGFKTTIADKIFGFWGHIHITTSYAPSSYAFETSPMNQNQEYYPFMDTISQINYQKEVNTGTEIRLEPRQTKGGIRHIQAFAQKEGIIKTKDQIEGIILRGVGPDYEWSFLKKYIKEGDTLQTGAKDLQNDIMISESTARRLRLKLGDRFEIYFVQEGASIARRYTITGIYKTGLEEYDRRFAIVDIRGIQQLNNWRPYKSFGPELWLSDERVNLFGVNQYTFEDYAKTVASQLIEGTIPDFSDSTTLQAVIPRRLAVQKDLGVGDTLKLEYADLGEDEYEFNYVVSGIFKAPAEPKWEKTVFVQYYSLEAMNHHLPAQVSGFEIFVDNIDDLDAYGYYINFNTLLGKEQYANTIKELEPNIFDWLNLTDMNERIILLLMILVSIINMTTSLMILILERTNMIGTLKALGARNWTIRQLFLIHAARIIGWGLLFGNLLGLGFCYLQQQFGIITLPEDLYYVAVAPIKIEWLTILLLNVGTLFVTLLVLIIPSWLVAKIDPVKAIRFK